MIEERRTTSPDHKTPKKKEKPRSDRENVWEARKNEALLDASNIERGILKDILFSETTKSLSRLVMVVRSNVSSDFNKNLIAIGKSRNEETVCFRRAVIITVRL